MKRIVAHSKKTAIGIVGGVVLLAGLVMIPYPGPGWLVVFAGLAILSTEFMFAERLLKFARSKYDTWVAWLGRQHIVVRLAVLAFTGLVIMVTIWLLNGFGIARMVFGIDDGWSWVDSPWL